jgi:hypothetical protein
MWCLLMLPGLSICVDHRRHLLCVQPDGVEPGGLVWWAGWQVGRSNSYSLCDLFSNVSIVSGCGLALK